MKDIRIASVVSHAPVGKIDENLHGIKKWVSAAKQKGAEIVCFPELNVTGYSTQNDIRLWAEPVQGKVTAHLLKLAKKNQIVILAGMVEKDNRGNIFASHIVFGPGDILGVYRKLHIAPTEKAIFSPGDQIPLFEATGVKFGIQLCYDAHFPELSTRMALQGAEIIFIPHASPKGTPKIKWDSWIRHLPARAYDNSVFVIACNQTGNNGRGLNFPGVAVAISPTGKILDKKLCDEEGLMITDLKGDEISAVRENRMHFFLPNRRPDLFGGD